MFFGLRRRRFSLAVTDWNVDCNPAVAAIRQPIKALAGEGDCPRMVDGPRTPSAPGPYSSAGYGAS